MRRFIASSIVLLLAGCDADPVFSEVGVELEPRGGGFLPSPPDVGEGRDVDCNIYSQDCPVGEKCSPVSSEVGIAWNALECVPVAPDPGRVGDACQVSGTLGSGMDDCAAGLMCWDFGEDGAGTCAPMVRGSEARPVCEDPFRTPAISASGFVALCLPFCSPLLQDCPDGLSCYPVGDVMSCTPDVSQGRGAPGDECEFTNVCQTGTMCARAEIVPGCTGSYCCASFCDLAAPDCPEELVCQPWEHQDPQHPLTADIGVCGAG